MPPIAPKTPNPLDDTAPPSAARRQIVSLPVPAAATSSAASTELTPGVLLARRYQIVRRLGAGGAGEVYEARDISLDDSVALKVLFPHLANQPQMVESLRREIRSTRRLRHPAIARTYDWGGSDGRTFLVMEMVVGEDLERRVAKGPLPLAMAKNMFIEITEALAEAHGAGVIHRDLKTANFLITPGDQIRMTDFGLSAMRDVEAKRGWGTPDFAPPEQAAGGAADPRSDLYALGIVFYHCLTGKLPYMADDLEGLLEMHRSAPIPDARVLRPEIPARLAALIMGMMAKTPGERPGSAREVLAGLYSS